MNIKFAFAVSESELFEAKHFGDADKYLLFEWNGQDFIESGELLNAVKNIDEEQEHGSKIKGDAIIEMLREKNIQVLVSKQFGRNIKMVNRFFVPVIINDAKLEEIFKKLKNSMKWVEEELQNSTQNFKLFTLKTGILKTAIKKNE